MNLGSASQRIQLMFSSTFSILNELVSLKNKIISMPETSIIKLSTVLYFKFVTFKNLMFLKFKTAQGLLGHPVVNVVL